MSKLKIFKDLFNIDINIFEDLQSLKIKHLWEFEDYSKTLQRFVQFLYWNEQNTDPIKFLQIFHLCRRKSETFVFALMLFNAINGQPVGIVNHRSAKVII